MVGYDHPSPCFTLDRFSDDHSRAFYKCCEYQAPIGTIFRRIHEKQLVGAPVFSIQVRQVVNDTGLPDLQIDDENQEVSFDWRGMLDQLMGEEHVFDTILSQRLGWRLDPGEDTPNILETHRKLARRSRLQRECRAKYRSNILDHYVHDETLALRNLQNLRLAASNSRNTHDDDDSDDYYDDDDDDGNINSNHLDYTKQEIFEELPKGAIIYNGNSNPGPKPGSIPRGIFSNRDYCSPGMLRPPPSMADLFSPRPLPELSWGRRPMQAPRKLEREWNHGPNPRKREMEENSEMASTRRRKIGH